ncbi:apolipoprotein R-like [Notamacropus eugenii]|uniref:apolipoprotein R-like n=1 Tax=Notamacropus eugenii TaxID=9315 RepID=UPI003B66CE81
MSPVSPSAPRALVLLGLLSLRLLCLSAEPDCRSPKTIANGNYKMSKGFFYDLVEYSCNDGYVLIGEAKITCGYSGWSHAFPHCQVLCPKPEISNGQMSSEKIWYRRNENVQVLCSPGYYLVGPQRITCSGDGSWIPQVSKCELKFPEGCEKVSAGYKLMQCLPSPEDVKMALEIRKLTLEIEMLELDINKTRDTNQSHNHHHDLEDKPTFMIEGVA